ncbi:SWIM zinc finger family protein [soil metagenome]
MPRRRKSWNRYPPQPAARPVEGGIKARSTRGAIAQTWWSQRFLDVLESFGMGPRLARGKTYARKGQVISMDIAAGQVTASVQGSRARPYRVLIGVAELSAEDWRHAEDELAGRAIFLAKLLAGEMPEQVEEAFEACELTLFPATVADLDTACSCPDSANPCKHIAAVFYLLAEAFDDDPFMILAWRGRDRDTLLERLRARRGGAEAPAAPAAPGPDDGWPTVQATPLPTDPERFWTAAGVVEANRGIPRVPALPDAVLRQLAAPDIKAGGKGIDEVLRPAYAALTSGAAAWFTD